MKEIADGLGFFQLRCLSTKVLSTSSGSLPLNTTYSTSKKQMGSIENNKQHKDYKVFTQHVCIFVSCGKTMSFVSEHFRILGAFLGHFRVLIPYLWHCWVLVPKIQVTVFQLYICFLGSLWLLVVFSLNILIVAYFRVISFFRITCICAHATCHDLFLSLLVPLT